MAVQTDIPSDLTDADRAFMFQLLNAHLHSKMLYSLLHGVYTGIVAVTFWNIFMNKSRPIGRVMIVVIILLYIVTTVNTALIWFFVRAAFVSSGRNFFTVYEAITTPGIIPGAMGTTGCISSILADTTIIWRCWIVWGRRWLTILLPILLLFSAIAFKIIATYEQYTTPDGFFIQFFVMYSSFILASTLLCTLLIIYRIFTVARAGGETGSTLRAYRHVIEVLVESSALYSVVLILYTAFFALDDVTMIYFDALAAIARGVAPTLLVGRVAAGHARPDDSWQGSVISGSLRFGTQPGRRSQTSSSMMGDIFEDDDFEAQRGGEECGYHEPMEGQEDTAIGSVISEGVLEAPLDRPGDDTS
ncbi:hypothetical protein ARMSODRAFT_679423 [Armillaria solidipes]|uniref:Family A G protein-coupled receptor-like protein n=1 Tax=Armillaria solidipes TaxID=1076256 RepID=A0A2H3APW9_9AGAR|nr:hypothetical protein ARMSODRAFT_679423 [Armillaria solidipes]